MSEKHSIDGGEGNSISITMRDGKIDSFTIVDRTGEPISDPIPLTPEDSNGWRTTPRFSSPYLLL